MGLARAEGEERVTTLELFFDLVFVFALTQVTGLLSHDPTWAGLGHGMTVLALLWWAWSGFAWLTNEIDPERDQARLVIFAAMSAMLVASLAVPHAFGHDGVAFAVAYVAVRALHLALFRYGATDPGVRGAIVRLIPSVSVTCALVVAGAIFDGGRVALWLAAVAVDWGGLLGTGVSGWHVHAGHFAERYGLIVIIALGESIVSIGVGASGLDVTGALVMAAIAGMAIAFALWWAYFDVVARVAERRFREAAGEAQLRIARDSYTVLHFPMVAGIILVALGIKKVMPHLHEPLDTVPAVALCGGVALYLAGHVAFRLRNIGTLNRQRCVAIVVALALIPVATRADAVVTLALVAGLCASLIAYEAVRFAEARTRMRALA